MKFMFFSVMFYLVYLYRGLLQHEGKQQQLRACQVSSYCYLPLHWLPCTMADRSTVIRGGVWYRMGETCVSATVNTVLCLLSLQISMTQCVWKEDRCLKRPSSMQPIHHPLCSSYNIQVKMSILLTTGCFLVHIAPNKKRNH